MTTMPRTPVELVASVLTALLIATAAGSANAVEPDLLAELRMSKSCLKLLKKHMLETPGAALILGHLYYTTDSQHSTCGWSPSSEHRAFTLCQEGAKKYNIDAPCLPMVRDSTVVARSYAEARRLAGPDAWPLTMATDPLRCGQEPGGRFYWLEHGYCDAKRHGPEAAQGLVIWNHGIAGTLAQHTAPPALALRLLQARGWDVIKINRHNLSENADSYRRAEQRTLEEVRAQRARGYRKIAVGGQSFGGRVALEAGTASEDIFATVAMAPGMDTIMGTSRDQAPTDNRLRLAKTERVAVVFPDNDELFGNPERGKTAGPVLARRGRPYLMLDESAGLRGHGGGAGGNFAFRYGLCLVEFLSRPSVPQGRFECPAADGWAVARELLPSLPPQVKVIRDRSAVAAGLDELTGLWYGELGEGIVSWALVDVGRPGLSVLYTYATSSGRGGGVYEATVEGRQVRVMFPSQTVLTVEPLPARKLRATLTPKGEEESNFHSLARRVQAVTGELSPAPGE